MPVKPHHSTAGIGRKRKIGAPSMTADSTGSASRCGRPARSARGSRGLPGLLAVITCIFVQTFQVIQRRLPGEMVHRDALDENFRIRGIDVILDAAGSGLLGQRTERQSRPPVQRAGEQDAPERPPCVPGRGDPGDQEAQAVGFSSSAAFQQPGKRLASMVNPMRASVMVRMGTPVQGFDGKLNEMLNRRPGIRRLRLPGRKGFAQQPPGPALQGYHFARVR